MTVLDDVPGFRRRFKVTPAAESVRSELEDDFHCMEVTLHHDGAVATKLDSVTHRAPWNTCPGADVVLTNTFTGVSLSAFGGRGEKRSNCTHLFDLAVLGAAHAFDPAPLTYDVLVSDPVAGRREIELRRDGATVLRWTEVDGRFAAPVEIAGLTLLDMSAWVASLPAERQEPVRILRWAAMVAHGRTIPLAEQSDATRMPLGNCYTFQPRVRATAIRIGVRRDFSTGSAQPLERGGP